MSPPVRRETIEKAVDIAYSRVSPDMFTDGYYRPKFDFVSYDYPNSIPNRYEFGNGWLYECDEWTVPVDKKNFERAARGISRSFEKHSEELKAKDEAHAKDLSSIKEMSDKELADLRDEIDVILNS